VVLGESPFTNLLISSSVEFYSPRHLFFDN
jgi:hypothetical protein